jgi:CHAD domain-containing protein
MKETSRTYILPGQMEVSVLMSGLSAKYTLQEGSASVSSLCYLDTFDWRLYDKGFICLRLGDSVYVLTDFSGEFRVQDNGPVPKKLFAQDFAGGVLGEKLCPLAGIRALLPQAEIARQSQSFQIVNRDQKTVLAGSFERNQLLRPDGEPIELGGVLRIQGVRGYDKILTRVVDSVQSRGTEAAYPEEGPLRLALAAQGRKPLEYRSQFSIILDPAESVVQAAQKIFLQLLEGMERNIPGIIEDIDSEFLHDFRVALRRTRSLLGSMKNKVPAADVDRFQQGLQKIGLFTGPVRDLDVYLLKKDVFHSLLPEELQEGLSVFLKDLARQRVKERQRLKRAFLAKSFQQFLTQWRRYVEDSLISSVAAAGHKPCRAVAMKAIRKRLLTIKKDGALIGPQSPDTALHSLRIQAKKLRYLLEFYRSLFPEPEMDSLVKSLKKLQDNLGSFNDLSVQQRMLAQYQNGLAGGEQKRAVQVAAALGGLITHLHEEQASVRQKFEQTFAQFTSVEQSCLFDVSS